MYSKGANLLHTIRQIANNDLKWREVFRGLNKNFYHQTVSSKQVEKYISDNIDFDLKYVFDQYLRDNRIPTLEYKIQKKKFLYRWSNTIDGFNMPIELIVNNENIRIYPENDWKEINAKVKKLTIDRDYYINSKDVSELYIP